MVATSEQLNSPQLKQQKNEHAGQCQPLLFLDFFSPYAQIQNSFLSSWPWINSLTFLASMWSFYYIVSNKEEKIRTATNCNILFNQTHNNAIKNTPTVATLALFIMPASKGTGFVVVISIGVITATRLGECLIIDDIMNTRSHTRCTVVLVTGIVKPNIAI